MSRGTPEDVLVIEGEVLEVLEVFGVAHVLTSDGWLYGLTRCTPGIVFDELRVGQRVRASVTRKLSRVLYAEPLG